MTSVSIIVVTTGLPSQLGCLTNLLDSLSRQSARDFELIIASESQSARLMEIFRDFFCPCERHRVIVTGRWNKCKTANRAIKNSCGDIIVLLEDDLVLEDRWLEKALDTFNEVPHAGCIYPKCIWVYKEGSTSKRGAASFIAKALSKLSVHESLLRRQTRRINEHLSEVPVFTMCVACKREALYQAQLFDESIMEPIQGEDFDLAFRIRAAGYKIVANKEPVARHYTKQVTKKSRRFSKEPKSIEGIYGSETYFLVKNRGSIGFYVLSHLLYRVVESFAWTIRSRRITIPIYCMKGLLTGAVLGLRKCGRSSRYEPARV